MLLHQMAPTNPQLTLSLGLAGRLESASASTMSVDSTYVSELPDAVAMPPNISVAIHIGGNKPKISLQSPLRRPDSPRPEHDPFVFNTTSAQSMQPVRRIPTPSPPPPLQIRARVPGKTRSGLPITLHKEGVMATVLSCADTGADVNIMSDELAKTLGYTSYETLSEKKQFSLVNGKIIEAIGQIESTCSFGVETELSESLTCMFYILLKTATPIIMGLDFLEKTKTMTEHRERLVRVPRPAFQALSVCAIDRPRNLLTCELDCRETMATPDSGSDIDMMSPSFASERGLAVYPGENAIELADGSIAITTGFVRAEISVVGIKAPHPGSYPKRITTVDFFVLDSLTHDLIVGEDSLEELRVFTEYQHTLVPAPHNSAPLGINRIRYLGAVDRIVSWIKKKIKGITSDQGEQGTYMYNDLRSDQLIQQRSRY
jgi:hypothetical protein